MKLWLFLDVRVLLLHHYDVILIPLLYNYNGSSNRGYLCHRYLAEGAHVAKGAEGAQGSAGSRRSAGSRWSAGALVAEGAEGAQVAVMQNG